MINQEISKMTDIDGSVILVTHYTVDEFLINLTFHRLTLDEKTKKEYLKEISPDMIPEPIRNRWLKRIQMKVFSECTKKELLLYNKEKEQSLRFIKNGIKSDKQIREDYLILEVFEVAGFICLLAKEKASDKHVLMKIVQHANGYSLDVFPNSSVDLLIVYLIPLLKKRDKTYHIQINGELILGIQKTKDINFVQVVTAYFELPTDKEEKITLSNTTSIIYKKQKDIYLPAQKEDIPSSLLDKMTDNGTLMLDEIFEV